MRNAADIIDFIREQPAMMRVLQAVEAQSLPDCWVGAGFIRNAVWDRLHGWQEAAAVADIDVVFFDPADIGSERDAGIEQDLARAHPRMPWSVRNQARMHIRNGDAPYADTRDALRHWPERCTAIAARSHAANVDLLAPFGVSDLLDLVVRPTPAFAAKMAAYRERVGRKAWHRRWPRLAITDSGN